MQSIQHCFDRSGTCSLVWTRPSNPDEAAVPKAFQAHKCQTVNLRSWERHAVHQCIAPIASLADNRHYAPLQRQFVPFRWRVKKSSSSKEKNFPLAAASSRRMVPKASLDADLSEQLSGHRKEGSITKVALGLAVLVAADQALQSALPNAALPSALVGCLLLTSALLVIDQASQPFARDVIAFFGPATEFLQRWLPLFYTPAIVMLPQVLRSIPVVEGIKIVLVLVVGLVTSFFQAGGLATLVRRLKPSDRLRSAEHMPNVAPYTLTELIPWAALTAGAGLVYYVAPTLAGSEALTAAPCLLGATVTGFLLSAWLPGPLKRLIHPSLVAAALVNALAFVGGQSLGRGWDSILGLYSTGGIRSPGAADILSSFIGPSILALAFTLNRQKKLIRDHLPELGVVVPLSALFSLFSAAFLARRLRLDPALSASLAARFVSPQVAAPLAPLIGGDPSLLVGASVLTGVLGSNLNRWLLSLARFNDPVARALAVSSSSHGLGSAALAAKDEDLLLFAQVAYTLTALFALAACSTPVVAGQLARLAGG
ncbi:LrgB-like protein [Klebsormidium nitens]|uniref:LrgB-like protein n=1 Tax=Klebsormidium nitens TaxID=105231 RepID=A0A1Y1I3L4_KLENI|nr:LrgB-like protein [Klebsormidium nitens]|eukprot:GAQ85530.1 LrgB-like protein [Klebsormidium nitens]